MVTGNGKQAIGKFANRNLKHRTSNIKPQTVRSRAVSNELLAVAAIATNLPETKKL